MKFSIVTPSFNQGRYIRDCLESVRAQTGVEVEHLVMDGGSTDETVATLREYPAVQWVSEADAGQTDAINKGFRRATGDWLMWLNADDWLKPGALAAVSEFVAATPACDVVYGDCDYVDAAGRVLRVKREGEFDFDMLLFYGCYIPSTATFLRRAIIDDGELPDPGYKVCMDFEYYLRLARGGRRFRHAPVVLASFRWHDSNISSTHAGRRYQERLRAQRATLRCLGRERMGNELLLRGLFRWQQAKRAWRRWRGC